jgi:hypothetical protein
MNIPILYITIILISLIYMKLLFFFFTLISKELFIIKIFISIISSIFFEKYILRQFLFKKITISSLHKFILYNIKNLFLISYFLYLMKDPIGVTISLFMMTIIFLINKKNFIYTFYITLFIFQFLIGYKVINFIKIGTISLIYPTISLFNYSFMRLYKKYIKN